MHGLRNVTYFLMNTYWKLIENNFEKKPSNRLLLSFVDLAYILDFLLLVLVF